MFVYEKKVDGVTHLYGNIEDNKPSTEDVQLTYTDSTGATITPEVNDSYVDGSKLDKKHMFRVSDDKEINVFIGDTCIIGEDVEPPVVPILDNIAVTTAPTKVEYQEGESLDLSGMVVTATYDDESTKDVTAKCVTVPEAGTILSDETSVEISYTEGEVTKTASVTISVAPAPATGFKHTIRMYANNGSSDSEFNAIIENDDDTEFTEDTLDLWLRENHYITSEDQFYENIENVAGPTVTGIASNAESTIVCLFEDHMEVDLDTFVGDTVTPAN